MSAIVSIVGELIKAIQDAPALIAAVKGVIDALHSGEDVTPALKHLEVVAAEKELGI